MLPLLPRRSWQLRSCHLSHCRALSVAAPAPQDGISRVRNVRFNRTDREFMARQRELWMVETLGLSPARAERYAAKMPPVWAQNLPYLVPSAEHFWFLCCTFCTIFECHTMFSRSKKNTADCPRPPPLAV